MLSIVLFGHVPCGRVGRLTWEIAPGDGGVTRLTVIHDLEGAPQTALMVSGGMEAQGAGGGWSRVLSELKSLLETGSSMGWHNAPNED